MPFYQAKIPCHIDGIARNAGDIFAKKNDIDSDFVFKIDFKNKGKDELLLIAQKLKIKIGKTDNRNEILDKIVFTKKEQKESNG